MRRLVLPLLALAACDLLDAPVAQLDRFEQARREGRLAAIAEEPVPPGCTGEACPRLHAIRAEACLALALADRAPGAACPGPSEAARRQLDCAAAGYAAAGPAPAFRAGRAQALLCRAELAAPDEALGLARAARSAAEPAADARLALLAGRAALLEARGGDCGAARDAGRLAAGGLTHAPDGAMRAALARLAADAAARRATIPGCGG
jgi:hypothetical protein